LKAREQFATLRDPARSRQWLWSIARNLAKNFIRDRKETVRLEQISQPPDPFSPNGHRLVRLQQALRELAASDREILILREYQGLTYSELAEALETSVPAVKSRLFRARENLRQTYFHPE
jgi:RNA polymerase sigma-70 factor (ECF subfamily)